MAKKTFETVLKWNGGEAFSMNPLRTRQLMQEVAYGK